MQSTRFFGELFSLLRAWSEKVVLTSRNFTCSHVKEQYPGVRFFHEDRPDIPRGAEMWHPGKPSIIHLGGICM
jgi:hypothetical protein